MISCHELSMSPSSWFAAVRLYSELINIVSICQPDWLFGKIFTYEVVNWQDLHILKLVGKVVGW
jgi:hypothetical protein